MSSEMRELVSKWKFNLRLLGPDVARRVLESCIADVDALLARTEARAPHHPLAICPTCKDYYEVCECTPDAAPVAVAWVLAYPDGSISSFAAVYRRKENAEKHIASYGGSLGLVPMPLYTHPQDASGDAVTGRVNGYMFSARAIEIITDGEVPEWITKAPGLRVTITAMQAKEAK